MMMRFCCSNSIIKSFKIVLAEVGVLIHIILLWHSRSFVFYTIICTLSIIIKRVNFFRLTFFILILSLFFFFDVLVLNFIYSLLWKRVIILICNLIFFKHLFMNYSLNIISFSYFIFFIIFFMI